MPRKRLFWIALGLLILFQWANHVAWFQIDDRQTNSDPGLHLRHGLRVWKVLTTPSTDILARISDAGHEHEPPLVYVATAPFFSLGGPSVDAAVGVNLLFLALIVLATYASAAHLFEETAGLLAAVFVSSYPLLAAYVRVYYVDIGLTAVVSVSFYALLRTEHFGNRRYSVLFGLSLAAGLLTKKAFVIFMFTPVAVSVVYFLSRSLIARVKGDYYTGSLNTGRRSANLLIALGLGATIPSAWYIHHADSIIRQAGTLGDGGLDLPWWWYLAWFDDGLYTFPFLVFLAGLAFCFRRWRPELVQPLAWFFGGLFFHSLIHRGHIRYMLPLYPAVAILSSWWIAELKGRALRRCAPVVTVAASIGTMLVFSWGGPTGTTFQKGEPFFRIFQRPFELQTEEPFWVPKMAHNYPPRKVSWQYEKILNVIAQCELDQGTAEPRRLVFGGVLSGFNYLFAQFYAMALPIEDPTYPNIQVVRADRRFDSPGALAQLLDEDFILLKSDRSATRASYLELFEANFTALRERFPQQFVLLGTVDLPDFSQALIYRREGLSIKGSLPELSRGNLDLRQIDEIYKWLSTVDDLSPPDDKTWPRAYSLLGKNYLRLQHPMKAALCFRKGLTIQPGNRELGASLEGVCGQFGASSNEASQSTENAAGEIQETSPCDEPIDYK